MDVIPVMENRRQVVSGITHTDHVGYEIAERYTISGFFDSFDGLGDTPSTAAKHTKLIQTYKPPIDLKQADSGWVSIGVQELLSGHLLASGEILENHIQEDVSSLIFRASLNVTSDTDLTLSVKGVDDQCLSSVYLTERLDQAYDLRDFQKTVDLEQFGENDVQDRTLPFPVGDYHLSVKVDCSPFELSDEISFIILDQGSRSHLKYDSNSADDGRKQT